MSPDDLRRWVERLEEFPAELLDGVESDRIAEIRAVCRAVGMRVRAGELRTHLDIVRQLPEEAVLGIAALRYPALRTRRAEPTANAPILRRSERDVSSAN